MSVAPGKRIGQFEILAHIGSGAMGHVYRARDPRLRRDVAIKVISPHLATDPERVHRFQREARAAGALNHPNVLVVHDTGEHEGAPYLVTEFLDGVTLRERIRRGRLPQRLAMDIAVQAARGIAAAHESGIVHRDLKPENVFLAKGGTVKVLDFGIARVTGPDEAQAGSATGGVAGTAGYMAPEQIRGGTTDHRADIFGLGAILFELVSGRAAFDGATPVERAYSTLNDTPPELTELSADVSPVLARIVARCLEKAPADRFEAARDVAYALDAAMAPTADRAPPLRGGGSRTRRRVAAASIVAATAGVLATAAIMRVTVGRDLVRPDLTFQRVSYRRGQVLSARFAPGGASVVYSASFDADDLRTYETLIGHPDARPLTEPGLMMLSMSPAGELALLDGRAYPRRSIARMPLVGGGVVRQAVEHPVWTAMFDPKGELAVVRRRLETFTMEYPSGRTFYEGPLIDACRFSKDGKRMACVQAPRGYQSNRMEGRIVILAEGEARPIGGDWHSIYGVDWSPDESELWVTASRTGWDREIHAIAMDGATRPLLQAPVDLTLFDVADDGRALVGTMSLRAGVRVSIRGGPERELSWLNFSEVADLTPDGSTLLLNEPDGSYVRNTDGTSAMKVSPHRGRAISPDGKWVVVCPAMPACPKLRLVPTGAGAERTLAGDFESTLDVHFSADSQDLFVDAMKEGVWRLHRQRLDGKPQPIGPAGYRMITEPSPDGRWVGAVKYPGSIWSLISLSGGDPVMLPYKDTFIPLGWAEDGRLYAYPPRRREALIHKIDIKTGAKELWVHARPDDPIGLAGVKDEFASNGNYAYSYTRTISDLYVVSGLEAVARASRR